MKYEALRFDSVTHELKKSIGYDDLKKAIIYARRMRDDISIRDKETDETIMTFEYGELINDYREAER